MTISKKMLSDAQEEGFQRGYLEGQAAMKKQWQSLQPSQILEAKIRLINAVGQTLNTQCSLIEGLARVMDNAPPR